MSQVRRTHATSVLTCLAAICVSVSFSRAAAYESNSQSAFPGAPMRIWRGFVQNAGQWDAPTRFISRQDDVTARLESQAISLWLPGEPATEVRLAFEKASGPVQMSGETPLGGCYHFYVGNDPAKWRSYVDSFASVIYRELYPGIHLRVRDDDGPLAYDLILAPGADLDGVSIRCTGIRRLSVSEDGALLLHTAGGTLRQTPPRTWEILPDGRTRAVHCSFRVLGPDLFGFAAPHRDTRLPLVIDPGLEWSTFLGGAQADFIGPAAPARDGSGDVFVGGTTHSPDFPGLDDPAFTGLVQSRAFIARLNSTGSQIVYATFVGGWHANLVWRGLDVDAAGSAVLCGQTWSPDFPTTPGAFDTLCENKDAFVLRLDPTGALIFSTFLGGLFADEARAVAYDPAGNVVVGGNTTSDDFPTTAGAFDRTYNAPNAPADGGAHGDMFIARLSPDGTQLTYGTFLGGPSTDVLEDLVVDDDGIVTVTGWATGNNVQVFVTTPDAFDRTWNGNRDGVVARLRLDGLGNADLKYATLIGGAAADDLWLAALDPVNPEFVTFAGRSSSNEYPTTPGVVRPDNPPFSPLFPNQWAGIVTRFHFPAAGGGSLIWSTYHHSDGITGLAVNEAGEPIIAGPAAPWDLFTTEGAFDRTAQGSGAPGGAFISRLSADARQYAYQSFFGGRGGEADNFQTVPQVAHVAGNTVLVSGQSSSYDFRITTGAADSTTSAGVGLGMSNEGFVMKLALDPIANGDVSAVPPTPIGPADGATFHHGLHGRIEWSEVADVSGVEAYEYQVAVRADFDRDFLLWRGAITETEAIIPPSVGNTGGLAQTTFYWRVRTADLAGNLSPWSATRSFTISPTTGQPTVAFLQFHPASSFFSGPIGGAQVTGMIHLYEPAPPGGLAARLTAHHDRSVGADRTRSLPVPASVPATVSIPAGATSAPFGVQTDPVSARTFVTILATVNGVGNQGGITLMPSDEPTPTSVSLRPGSITGGGTATGVVTLSRAAPAGGAVVQLSSTHPAFGSVPAGVVAPAGARDVSFPVSTAQTAFEVDVGITASCGGESRTRSLYVRPPNRLPAPTSMTISPTSVPGGGQADGTLSFAEPIPLGTWPGFHDAVVRFTSSDPDVAAVSTSDEVVPAGSASHAFRIFTRGTPTARNVTLSAYYDNWVLSRDVTVGAVTGVTVTGLSSNVMSLSGGQGGVATVQLAAPAPTQIVVSISSSHPALFDSLPGAVFISGGSSTGSFAFVTSRDVSSTTSVTVTAAYGASAANVGLTVGPPAASQPPVVSVAVSPSSVPGGSTAQGTVTLAGLALSGGATVQLFSGNTNAATVPNSVVVPEGAASASFTINTLPVASETHVTIEAVLFLTAGMSMTVQAAPAPPQTATVTFTGRIERNSTRTHTVNITGTGAGSARLSWVDNRAPLSLAVRNPAGSVIASGSGSNPLDLNFVAAAPGTYSFVITNPSTREKTDYTLVVTYPTSQPAPDTTPPTVSITSPANGATVGGTVTISAGASDNVAVTRVDFLIDGVLLSSDTTAPYSASWNTTSAANGSHSLTARAFDAAGNQSTSAAVGVTVDNAPPPSDTTPPTVSITSPANGATVGGTVTISAAASDNVGVTRVDFLVDGVLLSSDTTAPYSASWNTTSAANGSHSLTARAFDAAGNQTTSSAVGVTVDNGAPAALNITLSGVPSTIARGQFFTATGTVTNTGGTSATGLSVTASFTPGDSLRLEDPRASSQTVPTVAPGSSHPVSWLIRAERAGTATLTYTLRDSNGAVVASASQSLTIVN